MHMNISADFLAAGYSKEVILDIIVGTAMKVMSNYTNHITNTKVDQVFENGDYLLRPKYYPSIRNAELIKIKFKQTDKLEDMIFNTRGMSNAMKQSERICFSEYELEISKDETTV